MARRKSNGGKGRGIWVLMGIMLLGLVAYGFWHTQAPSKAAPGTSVTQKVANTVHAVLDGKEETREKESEKPAERDPETGLVKSKKQLQTVATAPAKAKVQGDGHARMAIVLDDFGYNNQIIKEYNAMPIPLTYAVLPHEQYSTAVAESGHAAGKEIIVHLPMESKSNVTPEPTTIRTGMDSDAIYKQAKASLGSVPYAIGMNNHQGSRATEDERVVGQVMRVLAQKGFFIVDSRTSGASVIPEVANAYGVPYAVNTLFLDNSSDVSAIQAQLRKAAQIALEHGSVIVIGHDRPNTAKAIGAMIQPLQEEGITFVFVSSLVH